MMEFKPDLEVVQNLNLRQWVLSAFFESPQHDKPPDFLDFALVAVCPNSNSDSLGVLAPVLPQSEMFRTVLPQNEVGSVLQNRVFEVVPSQTEVNKTVLPQNEMFNRVIHTVNSLLNIADKIMEFLISTVIHSAEKLAWTIRILLECLQHIWKMYA
jgi:hypothetical protein